MRFPRVARRRLLFHGTTRATAERALVEGLRPGIGAHTLSAYGAAGLVPLVFAADDPADTIAAIRSQVGAVLGVGAYKVPRVELVELGAVVEVSADGFKHRGVDGFVGLHPSHVEPGDYYSRDVVPVLRVWSADELGELLAGRVVRR